MRGKGFCLTILIIAALGFGLKAQKSRELGEIIVTSNRPMKDIGVQKTIIDSLALKENLSLSMADVLAYNTSVFVKSHGRATLSTIAFRGTSPSHTQVTWNGMKISNPMLGMTDFSTIPSFFIDRAELLHGSSSVNETGGGLGGLVRLGTIPDLEPGLNLQYVQGIGSFSTFDEFLRFGYSDKKWSVSTRAVLMTSPNDYTYINHDKKVNIYDEDHNIISQYHPKEKNRSGAYKDFHILQEVYYNTLKGDRLGLNAWYISSNRELPLLTTDYSDDLKMENRQREETFRGIVMWDRFGGTWQTGVKAGYIYTWMAYDYKRETVPDNWSTLTRSRNHVNTFFAMGEGVYNPNRSWFFNATVSAYQHLVKNEDKNVIFQNGDKAVVGYDKGRFELAGAISAKWQPLESLGMSVVLREEICGTKWTPFIPAFFIDWRAFENLTLKSSVSRNYKFPTLNDLYFLPGGNPDLRNEKGINYDVGVSYKTVLKNLVALDGNVSWFDSYIDDWIIWLPTTKGFFSPRNIKRVHAYGVELGATAGIKIAHNCFLSINGSYSWTPSINRGEKISTADRSVGKQLPYVPLHSASVTGHISWRGWGLLYKWNYYSKRFTMSSNDYSISGHLPDYFMNNISIEKNLRFKPIDVQLKLAVNNLFNEDYLSVLSRPMPGINFEFFVSITPKFKGS